MKKLIGMLLVCVFSTGCATHGSDIDSDFASQIQKGTTTEQEVVSNLGNPQSIGLDGQGNKVMTYVYAKSKTKAESFIPVVGSFMGGADTESKTLLIIVDNQTGVVKDFAFNESNTETKTGIF